MLPCELGELQFYNQRKSGEGEKITFFLILEQMSSFHHQFLLHVGKGSFLVPTWSNWDCHSTMEMSKKAVTYAKNGKSSQVSV